MTKRIERMGESVIVYDDELASQIEEAWFEPSSWPDAASVSTGGRGRTLFVTHNRQDWVIRHYYRGGMIRRFLDDEYLWLGENRTRSFREWNLLRHLVGIQLPVPRPVAARFIRRGLIYTADLITERIPDVHALSRRLMNGELTPSIWQETGMLIARFHAARIDHADLNAHNIQINSKNDLFLLDFDRGRVRSGPGTWTDSNLKRLRRSLQKVSANSGTRFSDQEWAWLVNGYRSET